MKIHRNVNIQVLLIIILFSTISSVCAQNENNKWHLKINYASLKPMIINDQWFVTDQGYHIHPRTENYTPGLSLSIERSILKKSNLELMFLYGRPKAVLGIVDQNSTFEPVFKKGYNFFAIIISPNINLLPGKNNKFYISPICGFGMTSELKIIPTIGPEVTWARLSEFIYGVKGGFKTRMKNELFFNAEFIYLSMKAKLTEDQTNRELSKAFGPFGILLGFSYAIK